MVFVSMQRCREYRQYQTTYCKCDVMRRTLHSSVEKRQYAQCQLRLKEKGITNFCRPYMYDFGFVPLSDIIQQQVLSAVKWL